ncbi:MAG: hypothetical protein AAFR07_05545 [Pseudomonadota bacterium]
MQKLGEYLGIFIAAIAVAALWFADSLGKIGRGRGGKKHLEEASTSRRAEAAREIQEANDEREAARESGEHMAQQFQDQEDERENDSSSLRDRVDRFNRRLR